MSESDRSAVFVHLLPSLIPPGALAEGVAVIVDVLRATTVMVQALASGCESIVPCLEIDDARRVAGERPPGQAILAGERLGLPIADFDLGNSPAAFTPEACRGKTLVMTTTNGTRAILASLEAEHVLIGAFVNLGATVRRLKSLGRPVHIVCAGTDGQISLEDTILAGALASRLTGPEHPFGNDETEIAGALWRSVVENIEAGTDAFPEEEDDDDPVWHDAGDPERLAIELSLGRGGRRVRELGLEADIRDAAWINRFDLVAELRRDPLRIERME